VTAAPMPIVGDEQTILSLTRKRENGAHCGPNDHGVALGGQVSTASDYGRPSFFHWEPPGSDPDKVFPRNGMKTGDEHDT